MKIAYILSSLKNAGPIVVAYELVQKMIEHNHQIEVFYFDDKKDLDFPCPTHQISMWQQFEFNNYDLIHCHGLRPDLFVLLHKPIFCKIPICTTIHSYIFLDYAYKYGKYWSKITARIVLASTMRDDKIILLSKDMLVYYKDYLPNRKLTYAYNTRSCKSDSILKNEEIENLLSFKDNNILLCSVSGLNKRKGLHQIIQVLPQLPNVRYCIVGDGNERRILEDLVSKLGLEDRVLFIGHKPDGFRYLKYADIFVMPSYSEGFPLAMLEAASMQKAIVCSEISVFKEIFSEDEIATFEVDNLNSLQNALLTACHKKDELALKAHSKYVQKYSPECFYNRHIEIYQEIVKLKKYNS